MPTPRGLASRRCAYRPFASFAPNTAILQDAITEGLSVRTIRAFYRDHFIDLEEDVKQEGWRVVAIIHSTSKRALSPPEFVSPDDLTAELHAKEAVDQQITTRPALDWGDVRRRLFPPNTPPVE
jgi:ethanolamine ammonia-lyase small subunit